MVPQETQTLSCLLHGRTGLIGQFLTTRPREINFTLEGTPLRLIGFNACHQSVITEPGQKKVAGFARGRGKKCLPAGEWRDLTESANAVLFTKRGRRYEVEILRRAAPQNAENDKGVMAVRFEKTGARDRFIPCRG